jgi:aromatic ring-opening dioxygenase LigB subunit
MANIVLGMGCSHGPLLSLKAEQWDLRAQADRLNPAHSYRSGTYTFDELTKDRQWENLIEKNKIEVRKKNKDQCDIALDILAKKLKEVSPDVVVLIGDDQHEWFGDEIQPPITIFHGTEVLNTGFNEKEFANRQPGLAEAAKGHHPPEDQMYPIDSSLAEHIIAGAIEDEFDVTTSKLIPFNKQGNPIGITHSVGFIVRRLMKDNPIPLVPVLLNTFWPPNQIKPGRCYDFGVSIGRAIRSWDSDKRVAIIASGGLSHFVIDEEWDRKMLKAFQENDVKTIREEPNIMFRSGTSETKNWITAVGALSETEFKMDLVNYVPCYRSEAGTGNAMGFAVWK